MRWLFPGKEVTIETRCVDCGDRIRVRTRDDEVLEVSPDTTIGYMPSPFARSRMGSGAFN